MHINMQLFNEQYTVKLNPGMLALCPIRHNVSAHVSANNLAAIIKGRATQAIRACLTSKLQRIATEMRAHEYM